MSEIVQESAGTGADTCCLVAHLIRHKLHTLDTYKNISTLENCPTFVGRLWLTAPSAAG